LAMAFDAIKIVGNEPCGTLYRNLNVAAFEIESKKSAARVASKKRRCSEGYRRRPCMTYPVQYAIAMLVKMTTHD